MVPPAQNQQISRGFFEPQMRYILDNEVSPITEKVFVRKISIHLLIHCPFNKLSPLSVVSGVQLFVRVKMHIFCESTLYLSPIIDQGVELMFPYTLLRTTSMFTIERLIEGRPECLRSLGVLVSLKF